MEITTPCHGLSACPFCGRTDLLKPEQGGRVAYVKCWGCGAQGPCRAELTDDPAGLAIVVANWNRCRPTAPAGAGELVERLKACADEDYMILTWPWPTLQKLIRDAVTFIEQRSRVDREAVARKIADCAERQLRTCGIRNVTVRADSPGILADADAILSLTSPPVTPAPD
jgi:hypothetical protein